MKVLLANAPWRIPGRIGIRAGSRWPFTVEALPNQRFTGYTPFPFFLAYATAVLKKNNIETECVDAITMGLLPEEFETECKAFAPDIILLETSTPSIRNDLGWAEVLKKLTGAKIALAGTHATTFADELLNNPYVDFIFKGEYELSLNNYLRYYREDESKLIIEPIPIENLDALPYPAWEDLPMYHYYDSTSGLERPIFNIMASRGCPYKCLRGDTLINTIYGMIPIKELVGKDIPVYSYDIKTGKVLITDAYNIQKTDTNAELIRVHFDDDSYIDCTPEHKFLTFTQGNQFEKSIEYETEAKNLKHKQSVRTIKRYVYKDGYAEISWGRHKREKEHRLVMEYFGLKKKQIIHHIDRDKSNNLPENLSVCSSAKEHFSKHPEISERMRQNNPTKNMTIIWGKNISSSLKGLHRTSEQKLNYRNSKLGRKNPNWKGIIDKCFCIDCSKKISYHAHRCRDCWKKSRKEINHKVDYVEYLAKRDDVYCMEVPGYNWFFANNVLVHNCNFCVWNQVIYPQKNRHRQRTIQSVIDEIKKAIFFYPEFKGIFFDEDTFGISKKWVYEFAELYHQSEINLPFTILGRADLVDYDLLRTLKVAGLRTFRFGVESGCQDIVEDCGKALSLESVKDCIRYCKELNIKTHMTIAYGLPGESHQTVVQTNEFISQMAPDFVTRSIAMPYPGTAFFRYLKENNMLETEDWGEYDGFYNAVYHTQYMSRNELNDILKRY